MRGRVPITVAFLVFLKSNQHLQKKGLDMRQFKRNQGYSSKTAKMEKEYLFAPKTQSQITKYATFLSVKEKIVQDAQKKYKYGSDVAKSLKDNALVNHILV